MHEPPKPSRGRPRKLDIDHVLGVAMRAYWEQDPADVSINTICTLAEVSKPGLYREFGNEDGLMRAVLAHYAQSVLSDIFALLSEDRQLAQVLESLIAFASRDSRMATGCVFFKMRAGKHRLGPQTLALVGEIDAAAVAAFETYLSAQAAQGAFRPALPIPALARYILEQIGLAFAQRASGEDPARVETTMTLALSVLLPPPGAS
jgi:AcrR family transcriptional regulator